MRLDGKLEAGFDDRGGDRIVAAAGAQRRDLAFVVAMGEAERVLLQARMMKFRFCDVGHGCTLRPSLVMAGLVPAIHVLAREKKSRDTRAFASPKGLRPRRRVKPGHDSGVCDGLVMTRPCGGASP